MLGPNPRGRTTPLDIGLAAVLAARSEQLAKAWLVELIERGGLEDVGALPVAALASDGEQAVAATVAVLADDERAPAALAAAAALAAGAEPPIALRLFDALHAVLWEAAIAELRSPDAREVAALAERMREVLGRLRARALTRPAQPTTLQALDLPPPTRVPEPDADASEHAVLAARLRKVAAAPPPANPKSPEAQPSSFPKVLEDEIHRAWSRAEQLALVLVELDDTARIEAAELDSTPLFAAFEDALRAHAPATAVLVRPESGRAWVIARGSGRQAARKTANAIAAELGRLEWHGAPLRVSAGIAMLGEDGSDAAALVDVAEERGFAAAAAGVAIAE